MARRLSAFGLGDLLVRLGLLRLQLGADVRADVDVGDVDREDLEGRARVESLREHVLRDDVGALQDVGVGLRRADRADDALADARQDRLLARAADQALDVRANRDARLGQDLDAVLRDAGDLRRRDDLRVDAHLGSSMAPRAAKAAP